MSTLLPISTSNFQDDQFKKRMKGLDVLRAFAIILVFMFHYPRTPSETSVFGIFGDAGWAGVDLFFVLSGYLISNQIINGLINRDFSLKIFIYRRLLRTLPNYWFVLALYYLIPGFREWHLPMSVSFIQFITFTQNTNLHMGAYSHAWSLCVEEQFYLVLPLLLLFMFYKGTVRIAWITIAALIAVETCLRAGLWLHYVKGIELSHRYLLYMPKIYYPTYTRLYGLIFGVAVAIIKNYHLTIWEKMTLRGNLFLIFGIGIIAACFYGNRNFSLMLNFYPTTFLYPLLDLGFAFLVVSALSPTSYLYNLYLPGAAIIASWSYAIYLIQKQVMFLTIQVAAHFQIAKTDLLTIIAAIVFTLLGGWLLYTCIEKPFLKLRDRKIVLKVKSNTNEERLHNFS